MKRVWVTRAQPGARATSLRLLALGVEPLVMPVLEVRFLDAHLELAGVGALAFTSANGVAGFAALSPLRDLPVFAVGGATAESARTAGFAEITSAGGDVGALAALIARTRPKGAVLHAGAAELAAALAPDGVAVRGVTVYETVATDVSFEDLAPFEALDGFLIHSPKAARRVAAILATSDVERLAAWCISPAAAAPLSSLALRTVVTAPLPNEEALLSLLAEAS